MVELYPLHIAIQLGIFLGVSLVLSHLVFKPVLRLHKLREQRMSGDKEEARRLVKEAEAEIHKYEDKIYQAKGEAKEIRMKLVHEAGLTAREILAKAREEATRTITSMRETAHTEARAQRPKLEKEIVGFARQMAETVLGRKIAERSPGQGQR